MGYLCTEIMNSIARIVAEYGDWHTINKITKERRSDRFRRFSFSFKNLVQNQDCNKLAYTKPRKKGSQYGISRLGKHHYHHPPPSLSRLTSVCLIESVSMPRIKSQSLLPGNNIRKRYSLPHPKGTNHTSKPFNSPRKTRPTPSFHARSPS